MADGDYKYILVAALDIGTTFSGYAFSFRTHPENITCNKNWGEIYGFQTYKTPTTILTNGAGEFVEMGYRAEKMYGEEIDVRGKAADLHIYRHFKMLLRESTEVNMETAIFAEDGSFCPAVKIFGFAIDYLKTHLLSALKDNTASMTEPSSILWVLTVPAIWSEQSKKFMREAAKRGGCISDVTAKNLILALEPEAASLCCRRPELAGYHSDQGIQFPPNTKYIVLDCGGGTVDITCHRALKNNKIEEILPASGGPWGGIYVDQQFEQLMKDIFGSIFINRYKLAHPDDWLRLTSSFETTKKPFNAKDQKSLRVEFQWSFGTFFSNEYKGKTIVESVEAFGKNDIKFKEGILTITNETAKGLFSHVINPITTHVTKLVQDPALEGYQFIFMVGGLSECRLLQDEIKRQFEKNGTRVLIPSQAQLAVLKGAVLFGHFPAEIASRIATKTYGYVVNVPFDSEIHESSRKYTDDDGEWCRGVFITLVKQGKSVPVGKEIKIKTYAPINAGYATTRMFCIDGQPNEPVQYKDMPNLEPLGKVSVDILPTADMKQRKMYDYFTFGNTEIFVRSVHVATKKENSASINFLSDPSIG